MGFSANVGSSQRPPTFVSKPPHSAGYGCVPIPLHGEFVRQAAAPALPLRDVGVDPHDDLLAVHHAVGFLVPVGGGHDQRFATGGLLRLRVHGDSEDQFVANDLC